MFYVNQGDYLAGLTEAAGIQVVVHDQRQMPFPENQGIAVSPGQLTYIGASTVMYCTALYEYGLITFT